MSSSRLQVLLRHEADLQSSLKDVDLLKLSYDLLESGIWSKEASDKFASLDADRLEPEIKIRYLLRQVLARVKGDDRVLDKFLVILSEVGGKVRAECEAVKSELGKMEGDGVLSGTQDTHLLEQDVPDLVECLVSGSHLWDAIGIALNLPKHKREDCGEGKENVNRLSNILTAWILGGYEGARPATLSSLRTALASETVEFNKLAQYLVTYRGYVASLPITKKARISTIISQSRNNEVAEGKSTLLEVQVSDEHCVSYQWSKDGVPLIDGADYSGVCSNILYINKASQCTIGNYSCIVSRSSETENSEEMCLTVIYPPEKKELLELYSFMMNESHQESWPPVRNSIFLNLALITKKPISSHEYYSLNEDVDDILESKELIHYEEVFAKYKEGGLILIEGRPGCGKTTLAHKLTRDWAAGMKVLQGAKTLFLVTLRLLSYSGRDKSLLDLLEVYYGEHLSKKVMESLQKCGGKGACFILDGLDEYSLESKSNSIIYQLLYLKTLLPLSMVIVTSRPMATGRLKTLCTSHIEILGFSKDQIYHYVRSYPFRNLSMVDRIHEFLRHHPNVLHMCCSPVHAAMICFLYNNLEGNIPTTETQIYEQFTRCTLLRQLRLTEDKLQLKEDRLRHVENKLQLMSLKDIPGEYKESLTSISKLAFEMIVQSQYVVRKTDVRDSVLIASGLGLFTLKQSSDFYVSEDLYHFHHLTLQEFLAAYYILEAKMSYKDLIGIKGLHNVWKFCCGLFQSTNVTVIDEMFKDHSVDLLFKVSCAFESQKVQLCDSAVGDGHLILQHKVVSPADFLALSYLISNTTQMVERISLINCLWDCEGVKVMVSCANIERLRSIRFLKVLIQNDKQFKSLNYMLLHLPFLQELDLIGVVLNQFRIQSLTNGIKLPYLRVLKVTLPLQLCSHPEEVLKQLNFQSQNLKTIFFSVHQNHAIQCKLWKKMLSFAFGCQISDIPWVHLCNIGSFSLPHERLSHCTEVVLVNCGIGDEGAEILANTLNTSVLENLVLDFNRISDSGAIALAGCLSKCSVVQEVSIQCNCIGDSGATALADALVHCNSLRKLDMQGNSLGDKGAIAVARGTKTIPNLDLYLHNVSITAIGIEKVFEYRASSQIRRMEFGTSWKSVSEADTDTLKSALSCRNLPAIQLTLNNISNMKRIVAKQKLENVRGLECDYRCEITDGTVLTLCDIIYNLRALHHISCCIGDLSSIGVDRLRDCLKKNQLLRSVTFYRVGYKGSLPSSLFNTINNLKLDSLDLSSCNINSEGMISLSCILPCLLNLRTLKLSNNNIDSDGATFLSEGLRYCVNLQSFDLSYNNIADRGAIAIAISLNHCSNLLELRIGCNGLTSKGISALNSLIISSNQLHCLDISECRLGMSDIDVFECIKQESLQVLNIGNNMLSISALENLKCFTRLKELHINNNNIDSSDLICLADSLHMCTDLKVLNLSANDISSDGVPALLNIFQGCKYLQDLNLIHNEINVDDITILVQGWQHESTLTLKLCDCCGFLSHNFAVEDGKCCSSCDHMLELYYENDFFMIMLHKRYGTLSLPKRI